MEKNRIKILNAGENLLSTIGRDALTIREVAKAANVQPPAIYRLFVDKKGLLDAIAERGFMKYMSVANDATSLGPVEELRKGWDIHVDFGIQNPELYKLMFGDFNPDIETRGAKIAHDGLYELMSRLASQGVFKVSLDEAIFSVFSSASGVVITLLSLPAANDSYRIKIRERLIADIMVNAPASPDDLVVNAATTLAANLDTVNSLSDSEKSLLAEWLGRID